jgi:hypothetical protein
MKVFIGNYISHFTPYRIAKKIVFWREDYMKDKPDRLINSVEKVLNKIPGIWSVCNILNSRERKVKIHIHDYDVWSMDHTLALIVVPMLEKVQHNKIGAPFVDDSDVPEELKTTSSNPLTQDEIDRGFPDENHFRRWNYVIEEMIWCFTQLSMDDWKSQFYSGEPDFIFEQNEGENLYTMKTGPNSTIKVDHEGLTAHEARINNGLRLFAKYYTSLWT